MGIIDSGYNVANGIESADGNPYLVEVNSSGTIVWSLVGSEPVGTDLDLQSVSSPYSEALGFTINNGGEEAIDNGGLAEVTTINSGGVQGIAGGTATDTTINNGGVQYDNGTASATTINYGGTQ
jgi:autotransporter passenger strand-loop-strand repeat protein